MSHATEFNQENLVSITKMEYWRVENAIKAAKLLRFTRNHYYGSSVKVTYYKTDEKFLLVSHYVKKPEGGLKVAYKCDKEMFQYFKSIN